MAAARYNDLTLYRRILREAWPYWPHIAGIFFLGLLSTPLGLLGPLPMKIIVDSVIGAHPLPGWLEALLPLSVTGSGTWVLLLATGLLVMIALVEQLQGLASALLSTYTSEQLVLSFRAKLFRHGQRLSLAYHDARGIADSIYRIQHDAASIQSIAISGVMPYVTAGVKVVSMVCVIFRLDWALGLIALTVWPAHSAISHSYRSRLRHQSHQLKKLESAALRIVQEVLASVRVVKAFGQEGREQERFVRRSSEGVQARLRVTAAEELFTLLIGLASSIGTALVLFIGIRHVQAGSLTFGNLLLIMGYLSQLYGPLKTITSRATKLQSALAGAERAFELLDEAPDVPERPHARPLSRAAGAVALQGVSFAYDRDHPVLQDISFEVTPGTSVGIAGTTGAGKTTLMNLLTRFYDPTAGRILLDGVDLRDYKLAELRNQFAIVLQEPVLFSTSIAENIAYARPGAGERDIVAAATAANAHEFILRLPQGYQTLVGERGMRLSGGERQRIALARAFLKDAPILILDEPTSSVDVKTEAVIMAAMERLMRGRTTFLIAHRLSTLDRCDMRLQVERGRLVEDAAPPTQDAIMYQA